VLLRWDRALTVPRLEAAFTEALRAAKRKQLERIVPEIEYSPLVTEWLLLLGREVARRGIPLNDVESFPALKGRVRYQATGLPLGDPEGRVELVLCHVARA